VNVATLEAALPAFTNGALTDVTAAAQVVVADAPRNVVRPSIDARWELQDETPRDGQGRLGLPLTQLRYLLTVTAGTVTQDGRRAWVRELRTAIHHRRVPAGVPGLDHAEVRSAKVGASPSSVGIPGGTGGARAELEVVFMGDAHPDDGA
jgi:hypothetical protein